VTRRLIVPIVEGHGEVEALPAILHRMAAALGCTDGVRVNPPIRVKAGSFQQPGHEDFARFVQLAAAKAAQDAGLVLILLDCEDDCPARRGPALLRRARVERDDIDYLVVLAYREFETWFIAAARSLCGEGGLREGTEPPAAPEAIRNAKGWLGERMRFGYDPVMHQLSLGRRFDLQQARAVPSFDRFYRRLGETLASGVPAP
jgi:Domain of unknown function (DUF4276)